MRLIEGLIALFDFFFKPESHLDIIQSLATDKERIIYAEENAVDIIMDLHKTTFVFLDCGEYVVHRNLEWIEEDVRDWDEN